MSRNEVSVDRLGRVSLEFRVHKQHKLYVAEESSLSGIIILTPGALVPAVVRVPEEEDPNPGLRHDDSWNVWGSEAPWREGRWR